ncbi:MAG: sugar ABC transporter substrate-binding protein [bacterium]
MKRRFSLSAAALLLLIFCFGCRAGFSGVSSSASVPLRITAVLPHRDYGYWTDISDGILSAKDDFPVDIKICTPQLNYNIPQMTELIKAATAARVDAVIVQGIDNQDYIKALEDARSAGVQVVFIDTDLPQFGKRLYVGTDNYAAGRLMGEKLVQLTKGKARVAVISGAEGYPNLELRLSGLRDAAAAYAGVKILRVDYGNYDSITVLQKYKEICSSPQNIDAVVCIEGTGALTFGNMLSEKDKRIQCILGFDYSNESIKGLSRGIVDGLILQQIHTMGYLCVQEIDRFVRTGQYSSNMIYTQTKFITSADLDQEGHYRYDK